MRNFPWSLRPFALGLVILLLAAACATTPRNAVLTRSDDAEIAARLQQLSQLQSWSFRGRLALSDGEEGGSGSLLWNQQGNHSQLNFHGALGRGAWKLDARPGLAILKIAGEPPVRAASVEDLAWDVVGWPVPIDALEFWVRGLHDPEAPVATAWDQQGNLASLEQNGWTVDYNRWSRQYSPVMPTRLEARLGDYRVKLIIREWDFAPSQAKN